MATTTYNIAPVNIGPSGRTSPAANIPANTYLIEAQLVSPDWTTATGTISYRVDFMVNGAWVQGGSSDGLPIGSLDRHGNMPTLGFGSDLLLQATQIRIWIQSSVTIRLGATIKVSTDWVPGT